MPPKTLIFIPTYNERDNAPQMCEQLHALGLDADILFVDDNSADGTGDVLESIKPAFPRLLVQHRPGKLGIGSAHLDGIRWAYDQGYQRLITMDCDFTHSPSDIPRMIEAAQGYDVVVGSRFLRKGSLADWSLIRRAMTGAGHFLTLNLLGLPSDASGAFRVYDLTRIRREIFELVRPKGYAFFFESLFILSRNNCTINEIPIVLPARVAGTSKMSLKEMWRGVARLFIVAAQAAVEPQRFKLPKS